jgi:hypothetical protein
MPDMLESLSRVDSVRDELLAHWFWWATYLEYAIRALLRDRWDVPPGKPRGAQVEERDREAG